MPERLKLYFNPRSRAVTARWMLEEVGADYELVPIGFEADDANKQALRAVNRMGKIPTLVLSDGTAISETPAIIAWLADAYPEAALAPAVGTPERGPYYRWLFFGGSCIEPALTETMMRKDAPPLPKTSVGWGTYEDVLATVEEAVSTSPYLLGERFSAADLYVGAGLSFAGMFGEPQVKANKVLQDYVARVTDRDAYRRSQSQ
ncbi:glutathione S-transferase family protein [Mangrovicella endophytica]|uniref:glutathione S-transferase family protein n=1 Tax=Mangrovicella endophytica TaxID=2066697 RepID=UPI000C9E5CFF|nr:glutathione S-transferase family protein [Mangrovicella endophytica]